MKRPAKGFYEREAAREKLKPGEELNASGYVVKAKHGLCIYCDGPLRKGSIDFGHLGEGGAHAKCHREQCED